MATKKTTNNELIYEQRYETYRHLDKLRWSIFQIGITVIGTIISFQHLSNTIIWGVSLILVFTGLVMSKINHGIDKNNVILKKAANALGDNGIPNIHERHKLRSVSWLLSYILTLTGFAMLLYKILSFVLNLIMSQVICQ